MGNADLHKLGTRFLVVEIPPAATLEEAEALMEKVCDAAYAYEVEGQTWDPFIYGWKFPEGQAVERPRRETDQADSAGRYQAQLDQGRQAIAAREVPNDRVTINPNVRFGRPAVGGISVDAICEQAQADESEEDIATTYGLPIEGVRAALAYGATDRT